jgi:hypothetical protein
VQGLMNCGVTPNSGEKAEDSRAMRAAFETVK